MKFVSFLLIIFFTISGIVRAQEEAKPPASGEVKKEGEKPPETSSEKEKKPDYQIKIDEIGQKVTELKEKIFNSKTRILLLQEQILHNVIAEARLVIIHKNNMGGRFILEQVLYHLDNNKIYFQENKDGVLDEKKEFEIFRGSVVPGNHLLTVEMIYRGNGALFTYLSGYKFKIKSSYTIYASKGRHTTVRCIGYEKGGMLTPMEESPSVKFEVQQLRLTKEVATKENETSDK